MTTPLGNCPFCKSDLRVKSFTKRIGKVCPHVLETSQVKCKRQSCGFSGPLIKGSESRAKCISQWVTWNTRTAIIPAPGADYVTRLIGEARLMLDTGVVQFGETVNFNPATITAVLDKMDAALSARPTDTRAVTVAQLERFARVAAELGDVVVTCEINAIIGGQVNDH
jgi:hypothetical protein